MAFTRKFLLDNGVPEDKIDEIMAERGRTLTDYVPKGDVEEQIRLAVEKAIRELPPPTAAVPATESAEYKELSGKYNMMTTIASDDFASVKPKYRETVYGKLDHSDKHKPYAEQLTELAEKYEEYFDGPAQTEEIPETPRFGAQTQGQMPKGEATPSFGELWGFVPKK